MSKNSRLWLMLAIVPIVLSIIIGFYADYKYGEQTYYRGSDSEQIIENEREFLRVSRYETVNAEEEDLLFNLGGNTDVSKYQTPEYIEAEAELLQTQSNYSILLENNYQVDIFAASDEMLETDNEGNPVFYEVEEGEWLALISEKIYGNKLFWRYIYDVNRDLLQSPDDIQPGMKLYLPNKNYFNIKTKDNS